MSALYGTISRRRPPARADPCGNRLLDGLAPQIRAGLVGGADPLELRAGQELLAPGSEVRDVFFPVTVVCSVLIGLRSGQRAETGMVGGEGLVGLTAALGAPADEFVVVQVPGRAIAVDVRRLRHLMDSHADLREAILGFVAYSHRVAKQTVACNAYHSIEQRLARWLAGACARAHTDEFPFTQDMLSQMVAATRPRVGEAAARLRREGIIDYVHGTLRIRSARRLAARSCECHATMNAWLDRSRLI